MEIRVESPELGQMKISFGAYFKKLEGELDEEDRAILTNEIKPLMENFQCLIHAALMLEPEQMISLLDFFRQSIIDTLAQVRDIVETNELRYNAPNN